MPLPTAQRGDDADVPLRRVESQRAFGGALVTRYEAFGVDAGGYRRYSRRVEIQNLQQVLAQALSGGDHTLRLAVEPAVESIARHWRRDVAGAHDGRRILQRGAGQARQP